MAWDSFIHYLCNWFYERTHIQWHLQMPWENFWNIFDSRNVYTKKTAFKQMQWRENESVWKRVALELYLADDDDSIHVWARRRKKKKLWRKEKSSN